MWNIEKIQELIDNQVEENINLDYKGAQAIEDKKEIAKDISAFANSDGGIIIYGIKEYDDRTMNHLPESIDPIKDIKKHSKEWLEQIINSNISPRIHGIKITPIRINSTHETLYVVEIPKSNTAHQCNFLYYRRFNFESVKMNDYEIKDVMNRVIQPKIKISFIAGEISGKSGSSFKVEVFAHNEGGIMANYLKVYLYVPEEFVAKKTLGSYTSTNEKEVNCIKFDFSNTKRDVTSVSFSGLSPNYQYGPYRYEPILPGMKITIGDFPCVNPLTISDIKLFVTIHVDNVQPVEEEFRLYKSDFTKITNAFE